MHEDVAPSRFRHTQSPIGHDVIRDMRAGLNNEVEGPRDNPLRLPIAAVTVQVDRAIARRLLQILLYVRQLAKDYKLFQNPRWCPALAGLSRL